MDRWDDVEGLEGFEDGDDPGGVDFDDWYDDRDRALIESWRSEPRRSVDIVGWSRSSAFGAVLTGMAMGLREVFQPPEHEAIVIEVDADGEPYDLPVQLFLDPDSPSGSLCLVHRDRFDPPVV